MESLISIEMEFSAIVRLVVITTGDFFDCNIRAVSINRQRTAFERGAFTEH